MAFNTAVVTASTSTTNTQSDSWKAQGFLNFYLPSQDGKRKKLGAIGLKLAKPNEKALLEWLNEDPSRAQVILSKLVIEYQSAQPADGTGFAL